MAVISNKQDTKSDRGRIWVAISLVAVVVASMAFIGQFGGKARADSQNPNTITGAWVVDAIGAPFQPHVATFHADNTMEIDNPEAGDPHTSDSVGMGPWTVQHTASGDLVKGEFVEINADRATNQFVSKLVVTFSLRVTGNTFTGPAQATYYNPDGTLQQGPFPATLKGSRIPLP
jgi:hypothetical protein